MLPPAIIPPPPIMPPPIMSPELAAAHDASPTASTIETTIRPTDIASNVRCPMALPEPECPFRLFVVSLTDFPCGEASAENVFGEVGPRALAARELANHPDDKNRYPDQEDAEDQKTDRPHPRATSHHRAAS
jgi:hypothetical protein